MASRSLVRAVLAVITMTSGSALRIELLHVRRALMGSAASAIVGTGIIPPAYASKFPEHLENLDRAAASSSVSAVQQALKTLGLPPDEANARRVIHKSGDEEALTPSATARKGASSFKVTINVPRSDFQIKYMWLAKTDGGGLAVKEFKTGEAPTFTASVPAWALIGKELSVVPCLYSEQYGIWRGEPLLLRP